MKKKVLFLIESFIVGGAEKILIDIVNKLNPDLYEITVCSVFKYSVYVGYQKYFANPFHSHIHYISLVDNHNPIVYRLVSYFINRFPSLFYKMMIGDEYDTVIAFYEGMPTALIASAQIKAKKIAWLHTTTDYSQKNKTLSTLEKERNRYLCYDQIVAVSNIVKESFLSLFKIEEQKCIVIYNSIDVQSILALSQKENPLIKEYKKEKITTFISVGRLTPVKGFDRIVKVAGMLKREGYDFSWWIVGDGAEKEQIMNEIKKNELEQNVLLLGHQDNPYSLMKMADCFVSTSLIEGLNISLIEAMTLKKKIIVSDIPVHREVLTEHSLCGGLFFKNEEGLFLLLKEFLGNKIDFKKYQEDASDIIRLKFLPDIQIEKISAIL